MKIWIPVWLRLRIIERAKLTPYFHLAGYMERFWVFCHSVGRRFFDKYACRVHHILRSDSDRDPHNHPWNFCSIILFGGYGEKRPIIEYDGEISGYIRTWYGPGSVLFRKAADFHMLELPEGKTTWTLVFTGPWKQVWGFLVRTPNSYEKSEFVPWRLYEEMHKDEWKGKFESTTNAGASP